MSTASEIAELALHRLAARGRSRVVREGASLLVRRDEVVVRVRPDTEADRAVAEREVALAVRLRRDGVPAVPMVGDLQPWTIGGHLVTAWRWCPAVRPAGPGDLGSLARNLRERTAGGGPEGVPPFDPLAHSLDVVGDCGDDPDVCFVRDRVEALTAPYMAAVGDDPLGSAVVHGDLHADNVVVAADGPLVVDLELGGWGPASYDLAPAVVANRRYGASAGDLTAFAAAAGADPGGWSGFDVMVEVYELWVTAWAVSVAHRRPDWAAEAAVRVASLRDGAEATWRLS